MGLSFQEQLLKAGLVDKKQVKKADHDKRVQHKKQRKGGAPAVDREKLRLQQEQAERARQDRALNLERNQQAQRKADQAAVQQLIAANQVAIEEGDVVYHYLEGTRIARISVPQTVADKLSSGRFGLARHAGSLVLLDAESIQKAIQRDPTAILAYNDPAQSEDEYGSDW